MHDNSAAGANCEHHPKHPAPLRGPSLPARGQCLHRGHAASLDSRILSTLERRPWSRICSLAACHGRHRPAATDEWVLVTALRLATAQLPATFGRLVARWTICSPTWTHVGGGLISCYSLLAYGGWYGPGERWSAEVASSQSAQEGSHRVEAGGATSALPFRLLATPSITLPGTTPHLQHSASHSLQGKRIWTASYACTRTQQLQHPRRVLPASGALAAHAGRVASGSARIKPSCKGASHTPHTAATSGGRAACGRVRSRPGGIVTGGGLLDTADRSSPRVEEMGVLQAQDRYPDTTS